MESAIKKTALENIKDNLPLLSILLAVLSLSRVILYYHYFGISIVDYIELTEAVTLCVPLFIWSALGGIVGFIAGVFQWKSLRKEATEQLNIKVNNTFKERAIAVSGSYQYFALFRFFPVIMIVSIGFLLFIDKKEGIEWHFIQIICLWIYFMSSILANEISIIIDSPNLDLTTVTIQFYIILILGLSYFILSARAESYSVIYSNYKYLKHVEVVVGEKIVRTSNTYRYVGKTKNYIYFYNIVKGSADIISLDDVKSFSILGAEPHINKSYKEDLLPTKIKVVKDIIKQKIVKDTVKSKIATDRVKQKTPQDTARKAETK
jgi:hypothetical protein